MDNKYIGAAVFIGGVVLGGIIVLALFFPLSSRLTSQNSSEETGFFIESPPPVGDKKLCEALTGEAIQARVPRLSIERTSSFPAGSFLDANCAYFSEGVDSPVLTFFYDNPDLNSVKERQKSPDASTRDIANVGDEAFLLEIRGPEEFYRLAIFFRVGNLAYSIASSALNESELIAVAGEAADKLRQ